MGVPIHALGRPIQVLRVPIQVLRVPIHAPGATNSGRKGDHSGPREYPDNLTEIFSSGSKGDRATVASPFDLQLRSYTLVNNPDSESNLIRTAPPFNIDQQRKRTAGEYQTYESLILADDFVIREGVVADMVNGGIGFRNHTIPTNPLQGVEWTEGLLWVEPESVCVDNNITTRFNLPIGSTQSTKLPDPRIPPNVLSPVVLFRFSAQWLFSKVTSTISNGLRLKRFWTS
jgi:hypothetical protein